MHCLFLGCFSVRAWLMYVYVYVRMSGCTLWIWAALYAVRCDALRCDAMFGGRCLFRTKVTALSLFSGRRRFGFVTVTLQTWEGETRGGRKDTSLCTDGRTYVRGVRHVCGSRGPLGGGGRGLCASKDARQTDRASVTGLAGWLVGWLRRCWTAFPTRSGISWDRLE